MADTREACRELSLVVATSEGILEVKSGVGRIRKLDEHTSAYMPTRLLHMQH